MNTLRRFLPTLARALDALKTSRWSLATALATPIRLPSRWPVGPLRDVDRRDIAVFGGLVAVAVGLAKVYPPAAWIFVGAFFLWISLRRTPE